MTTRADAHRPEFLREMAWKAVCRVATTAAITIATDLNAGDTLDGITLVAGDRVLVKNQAAGAQNGIYDVGATPVRSYDMDTGLEAWGCIVKVQVGTTNGGTVWTNTNATVPLIDTTALTFAQVTGSSTSSMVPYYIAPGDTFTVDIYKQALFKDTIEVDGFLVVNGRLLGVD